MTLAQGLVMLHQVWVQAAASHDSAGARESASQVTYAAFQGFKSVLATRWKHQFLTTWLLAFPRARDGDGDFPRQIERKRVTRNHEYEQEGVIGATLRAAYHNVHF